MRSLVFPLAIISLFTPIRFVALQTPHSTQAALASASQQLQDRVRKEIPEACPVTKPPAQPFVPPQPYWRDHHPDQFWYGTESLWTLLGIPSTWHIKDSDSAKLTYWHRGFDWRKDKPELTVVAKRLDREALIVATGPANAVFVTTDKSAMMTGLDIPSTGCWKITAKYRGDSLSFVVSVQ